MHRVELAVGSKRSSHSQNSHVFVVIVVFVAVFFFFFFFLFCFVFQIDSVFTPSEKCFTSIIYEYIYAFCWYLHTMQNGYDQQKFT